MGWCQYTSNNIFLYFYYFRLGSEYISSALLNRLKYIYTLHLIIKKKKKIIKLKKKKNKKKKKKKNILYLIINKKKKLI